MRCVSRQRQSPTRAFHPRLAPQDAIGFCRSVSVLSRARSNNGTTDWLTASGSGLVARTTTEHALPYLSKHAAPRSFELLKGDTTRTERKTTTTCTRASRLSVGERQSDYRLETNLNHSRMRKTYW